MRSFLLYLLFGLALTSISFAQEYDNSASNAGFIENRGQWKAGISYAARIPGMNVIVKDNAIIYDAYRHSGNMLQGHVVSMEFAGKAARLQGFGQQPGTYNYFMGNNPFKWISGARSFSEVTMKEVSQGIDAVVKFDQGNPRYDFIVRPGADPENINLKIKGADAISTDNERGLLIRTSMGEFVHGRIFAYQETAGLVRKIPCSFFIKPEGIGFRLGDYDKSRTLIIDPVVFSSYLGGSQEDEINDIASGPNGEFTVCGWTKSSDFNLTPGAYTTEYNSEKDVVVTKYSLVGTTRQLIFSTIIGGGLTEEANAVGIAPDSGIVVAGYTNSPDFPKKAGFGLGYSKENDPFVLKLKKDGSDLIFAACFGGSKDDVATGMKLAPDGSIYITGYTNSGNFPLQTASQPQLKGLYDIFITRISKTGTALDLSTYYGGTNDDKAYAIDVDAEGTAYVTGETRSGDFPIAPYQGSGSWVWQSPYDYSFNGGTDAFVIKMGSGGKIVYSTFFGGKGDDVGKAIAADNDGTVFFAGETTKESGTAVFPISEGAYQTDLKGGTEGFLAKLDNLKSSGGPWATITQALKFSTLFGQSGDEKVGSMRFDSKNSLLVLVGSTASSKYPDIGEKLLSYHGKFDAFVSRFSLTGSEINFSTLIGGKDDDFGRGIAIDERGDMYVAGSTKSPDFANVNGDFQSKFGGITDGFVTKIAFGSINITSPLGSEEICPGSVVPVKWLYSGINPGDEFNIEIQPQPSGEWSSLVSGIKNSTYDWTVPTKMTPGEYMLRVYHKSGLSDTTQASITILSPPVINSITKSPESLVLCEGEELKFTASVSGKGLAYSWKFNNKAIDGAKDSILTIAGALPENTGTYSLTVTGKCNPSATSENFSVTVNPATKVTNTFNDTTVKAGTNAEFTVNAKGLGLSYEWYQNDGKMTGKTESSLKINNAQIGNQGRYKCVVKGTCGTDTTNEFVLTVDTTSTGVDESAFSIGGLNVRVNYTADMNLAVSIKSPASCNATVRLMDNLGRPAAKLYEGELNEGTNSINYNTSGLSSGVYWLSVECGSSKAMNKVQIVK